MRNSIGKAPLEDKQPPNRLLQVLIGVSLVIHFFILLHVAGIYRSNAMTYIELSVMDFSKPERRDIPRPRVRNNTPEVREVSRISVPMQHVPDIRLDKTDTDMPGALTEAIGIPDVGGLNANISQWQPGGASEYMTRKEYFDMLRMRVESRKKYPDNARKRQIEGSVKVGFSVETDGNVSDVKVLKTSRHPDLDHAALIAVKDAAPFPYPPAGLFDGPFKVSITIMFELM
ncbi:MAG: energy transducer TonB [Pseudomonadota bacterium]